MFPAVQIATNGNSFLVIPPGDVPALVAALNQAGVPHQVLAGAGSAGETIIDLGQTADLDVMEDVLMQVYPNG